MRRDVLIDCDPGHDDIMAILCTLAHPEQFHLLGITTVCGNNLQPRVTQNLLQVLTYLQRTDIPVAAGAISPLLYQPEPQAAHGVTGLDGFALPPATCTPLAQGAVEFMKEQILSGSHQVEIMALAPLTNIALLLKAYPEVKEKIRRIVLMGGSVSSGNILPRAEFNIYGDPHAAQIVMASGVDLVICPLEVCQDCSLHERDIKDWQRPGHVSQMVHGLLDFYAGYSRRHHLPAMPIFDLSVPMYLLHPDWFRGTPCRCQVVLTGELVRGMTVIEPVQKSQIKVLLQADQKKFAAAFHHDIDWLDRQYSDKEKA